jgi:hypothetical protein
MKKNSRSRSAQVIAFLKEQATEDEQAFVTKKIRSSAIRKTTTKNKSSRKAS